MAFHFKCIDCGKFGKECTDATGTEPVCSSFVPKLYTFDPEVKPQYYEGAFIFKSLFPDLMPTISLKIHCDDPEIDPNFINRIKRAAYREYTEIMKERQNAAHGFHVSGTWDQEGSEDNESDL